ncbi:MAG TPA: fibro-slime domain-containing protein [Polyangiaceae bacterium]
MFGESRRRATALGWPTTCLALFAFGLLAGCGARTGLLVEGITCRTEGEERSCENACGEGTEVCEDGKWSDCEVPPAERSCTDACGTGTQTCSTGRWSACDVAPVTRTCTNVCGTGTEVCDGGSWGRCEVAPVENPCDNLCGQGVQRCENGMFGRCEVPIQQRDCMSVCGPGHESCVDGNWQPCDAPLPRPPDLDVVIRDFRIEHPDFEIPNAGDFVEPGIVASVLGADDKPVYAGDPARGTLSTTGAKNFSEWYNDVPGVNMTADLSLELAPAPAGGLFVYEDTDFFPIDDQLFGNEGLSHNFHFTLEARTDFQYIGGEVFRFTGDDDMWVFINRQLAIDLGGLHRPASASIDLDRIAGTHGLALGQTYPLHFFFAERHTIESNFTIETSIAEPGSCD